jgi:hypothetical protein
MGKKPGPAAKKGQKKKRPPAGVSTGYLAEMLGVTIQRISQLVALGMPRAGRGMYPTRDAVRWYVEFLRKGGEKPNQAGPSRQDIARDLEALKLKKALGEVFDRQDVLDTTRGAYVRLGAEHEALATRIGRELNLPGDDVKMIMGMTDEMRARFVEDMGEFIDVVEPPAKADGSDSAKAA